jgi:4-amino-4-deoxy-L-arabinose transferase-like glycosyltransferase
MKVNTLNPAKIRIFICLAAAFLFIPFLGGVHLFDWDEINFAEAAREMIVTGDYFNVQINYLPFWEKPPLFIWMQVFSMKLFGINEFAARFPNAVCGIVTLLVLFNIGRKLHDNLFGLLWVLAFAGSVFPFLFFRLGIIDPWFNLFIFLGIWYLALYSFPENSNKYQNIALSAVFAGLAILTKGPVGFLLIAITGGIFLLTIRFRIKVKVTELLLYFFVFSLVGGSWYILQILSGNYNTMVDFIVYQIRLFQTRDAGHGGFWGYHFVVLFFTVFPTSLLALKSFSKEKSDLPLSRLTKSWMLILLCVVLVLFSIVKTKIVHYSSLAYFPLTFLAAGFVYSGWQNKLKWNKWISALIIFVAMLLSILVLILPFTDSLKQIIIGNNFIKDAFTVALLNTDGGWHGFEIIPGILFITAVIYIFVKIHSVSILKRAVALWMVTLFFTYATIILFMPRIEKYSQNALIEFFKSKASENVYLKNIYFKSYAIYFYGETMPQKNINYYDENWLLSGKIDKNVFFITKIHKTEGLKSYSDIVKIGEKNGYVIFERKAKN